MIAKQNKERVPTKIIAITKKEAQVICDSFSSSSPTTKNLFLKVASVLLEFSSDEEVDAVEDFFIPKKKITESKEKE